MTSGDGRNHGSQYFFEILEGEHHLKESEKQENLGTKLKNEFNEK